MGKTLMGPQTLMYPLPAVLVGTNIDNKPNFMTAAWCGVANSKPPMLSVAIRQNRHTQKWFRENSTFSISIPSVDQTEEVSRHEHSHPTGQIPSQASS